MLNNLQQAGFVLVNKPAGVSSNQVVNIVKRCFNAKKAGHLGTLDVAGEGLLPVALNKATTLFDFYLNKDKCYQTVFQFGLTTDTLDREGKVTDVDNKTISQNQLEKAIPPFVGKQNQMPPQYSAKRVQGKRAYDIVRAGGEVKLQPKQIEIYSIKVLQQLAPNTFLLNVECSSGTYIRSLVRDIAQALSTYGVMQRIIRTRCGDFDLQDAFTLEEVKQGKARLVKVDEAIVLPRLDLTASQAERLLQGVNIAQDVPDGLYNAYQTQHLGIVRVKDGKAKFEYRLV